MSDDIFDRFIEFLCVSFPSLTPEDLAKIANVCIRLADAEGRKQRRLERRKWLMKVEERSKS